MGLVSGRGVRYFIANPDWVCRIQIEGGSGMGRLPEITFGASVRIINELPDERARHMAIEDMRMALADRIVKTKMEVKACDFHTEYSLHLYVFTPDEFMKEVNQRAEELDRARQYWGKGR